MYRLRLILVLVMIRCWIYSQDVPFLLMDSSIVSTYAHPGMPFGKNVNIAIANIQGNINSGDIIYTNLVSENASGQRFLDINPDNYKRGESHNLSWSTDLHSFDLGIHFGRIGLMVGHAFRHFGQVSFNSDLLLLYSQGNQPYIGESLNLSVTPNITAMNEVYLGGQMPIKSFSFGLKVKLLYGTANSYAEKGDLGLYTDDDYYALTLSKNYILRSSSLVRYYENDSITFDLPKVTFDNFFYNNRGFALDFGIYGKIADNIYLSLGATDIGKINWDFTPRKYAAQGESTFSGYDIVEVLRDSTSFSISDSLSQLLDVQRSIENYSTSLKGNYNFGLKYITNKWVFGGFFQYNALFEDPVYHGTLSAVRKFKFLDLGLSYSAYSHSYNNLGVMLQVKMSPIYFYVSTDNLFSLLNPEMISNLSGNFGITSRF
ncbi:MAG: DUF5723 family protein [Saprospiraceae bacterium]